MGGFFGLLAIMLILFVGPVILIAYLAAQSRKKKQKTVVESLPSDTELFAMVRYNKGDQHQKVLKLKAFEGSGVLYVIGDTIHFKSTKGLETTFPFNQCTINYTGETFANGLLKWFSISNQSEIYYFNVESGTFIFHTGSDKPTTLSIFNHLQQLQAKYLGQ